jgi:DNA mismatch repair protein MutL
VASKIAAGEVIIRPASVVKELVENSLDAGAGSIVVELEEGGCRLIRVVDDGCGMASEEAPLSLQRHATSKLRHDRDLLQLQTLGFRGEALPSIAAVSRLEVITRSRHQEVGCRLQVEEGQILENFPWAGAPGTQITAAELFYNIPARQKFLKSKSAEQGQILELMRQMALGYPQIHFEVKAQGKAVLQVPAHKNLEERLTALLGIELAQKTLPFSAAELGIKVGGLLSAPDHNVGSSRYQFLLVNHRVVADRLLGAALREAYQGLLPRGRFPVAVIHLEVPPDQVDINVHPAKAEVRFRNSGRIYSLVLGALRRGLQPLQAPGRHDYQAPWQPESLARVRESFNPGLFPDASSPLSGLSPSPDFTQGLFPPPTLPGQTSAAAWRFADLAILGQLHQTYIMAQAPEGLILIDQHAAHERVLYESLTPDWERPLPRQSLLFPRPVELGAGCAAWVQENIALLNQAGIEVEPFGGNTFLLTALPACLAHSDPETILQETVNALAPEKNRGDQVLVRERLRLTMSCRGAIKAGQRLSPEEIQRLLLQLDQLPVSSHCPHGRPLWRLLTIDEIRQSFLRS